MLLTVLKILTGGCLLLAMASATAQNDLRLAAAEAWAQRDHHCALDHGYVCRDGANPDNFESIPSIQSMIPASYLLAWQVAAANFATLDDIPRERRDLKHYQFGFTEDEDHYIIQFQALLLPEMKDGKPDGIIRATFGVTVRYWVEKKSLVIANLLFYKT